MELFEESGDNEGVTEVQEEAAEHQALVFQVGGVWSRVDVAHGNLQQQQQHVSVHQLRLNRVNEDEEYVFYSKKRKQSEALMTCNGCT